MTFVMPSRVLLKSPAFTIVAVVTLGLGNRRQHRHLQRELMRCCCIRCPIPDSERIVTVSQTVRSTGVSTQDASPANFLDWSAQNSVFSTMACARGWQANLSGGEQPERIHATMASSQFFPLFGVNPILGRAFGMEDAKPGNARVAVLSHGLWARRYGADRNVIGREPDARRREAHHHRRHAGRLFARRIRRTLDSVALECSHSSAFA